MGKIEEMTHSQLVRRVQRNTRQIARLKDSLLTFGIMLQVVGKRFSSDGERLETEFKETTP